MYSIFNSLSESAEFRWYRSYVIQIGALQKIPAYKITRGHKRFSQVEIS